MNCRNLIEQLDRFVNVIGYKEPAIRGTNVSFNCPKGFLLSGPDTTMCVGNGEWEPDPREAVCKGENNGILLCRSKKNKKTIIAAYMYKFKIMIKYSLFRIRNEI